MTNEEMALHLIASGWRVTPPLTHENCRHPRAMSSGAICGDGSGYSEMRCPDCGICDRTDYPPRQMTALEWLVKQPQSGGSGSRGVPVPYEEIA